MNLVSLLARFSPPQRLARTAEEREAIYRFRYSVYGEELRLLEAPGIDHARKMLPQPQDVLPETRLFYTGTPRAMTGAYRASIWDEPPPAMVEELSLAHVPRVGRVAYIERMMVRPSLRGRLLFAGMLWHGYPMLVREGVDVCLVACMPGLAKYYVSMGARPYGARLIEGGASMALPLMILMHDVSYLRRIGSFMAPQARKYGRPFDPAPFAPLFDPAAQPVVFERERIFAELRERNPPLFQDLGRLALQRIAQSAFVLRMKKGELVVRKGTFDREMYLVLSGALDVEGRARIGEGQTVGEIAFLGTPGVRTATVRAAADSRLLVLRRKFLDELAAKDIRAAYVVARRLGGVAADRFAERAA